MTVITTPANPSVKNNHSRVLENLVIGVTWLSSPSVIKTKALANDNIKRVPERISTNGASNDAALRPKSPVQNRCIVARRKGALTVRGEKLL